MKQSGLLIRSVSFQQLDRIWPQLMRTFPDHQFSILTHQHSLETAAGYAEVVEVIPYPSKGSFQFWRLPYPVRSRQWDLVIVPVGNSSGSGFLNVYLAAMAMSAKQRFQVNLAGEFRPVRCITIFILFLRNVSFAAVALPAAICLWMVWLFCFILVLAAQRHRHPCSPGGKW